MLNCYPDNVQVNIVLPVETERTVAVFEWYLAEKDLSSAVSEASVRLGDQVQHEDIAICEAVQRNLYSRVYRRGRYSALQEKGVHAFHRMYENAMQKA